MLFLHVKNAKSPYLGHFAPSHDCAKAPSYFRYWFFILKSWQVCICTATFSILKSFHPILVKISLFPQQILRPLPQQISLLWEVLQWHPGWYSGAGRRPHKVTNVSIFSNFSWFILITCDLQGTERDGWERGGGGIMCNAQMYDFGNRICERFDVILSRPLRCRRVISYLSSYRLELRLLKQR